MRRRHSTLAPGRDHVGPLISLQGRHNARTIVTRSIRSPGRGPGHRINGTAVDAVKFPEGGPVWACTRCGGQLSCSLTRYSCDACGHVWPAIDGIPHFVSEAPYWGEIAESKLCWALE